MPGSPGLIDNNLYQGIYSINLDSNYFTNTVMKILLTSNNTVQFLRSLEVKNNTTIPDGTLLFTLPTELRPQFVMTMPICYAIGSSTYKVIPVSIGTNGYVRNREAIPSGTSVVIRFIGVNYNINSKYY